MFIEKVRQDCYRMGIRFQAIGNINWPFKGMRIKINDFTVYPYTGIPPSVTGRGAVPAESCA
jgi:hypothetical protein